MDAATLGLLDALPHRPPFRFLTEVTLLVPGESGEAVWKVAGGEAALLGHFPGLPIVPGTLIAEAMAQLCGLVAFYPAAGQSGDPSEAGEQPAKLVHVDLRFKEPITPPATIVLRGRLARSVGVFRQFEVSALCDGKVAARGQLTLSAPALPRRSRHEHS